MGMEGHCCSWMCACQELECPQCPKTRAPFNGGPRGLCIAWVNPAVQEAEDAVGCSRNFPTLGPPELTPFTLRLLRTMSQGSVHARALSPGEDLWAEETSSPSVMFKRQAVAHGCVV